MGGDPPDNNASADRLFRFIKTGDASPRQPGSGVLQRAFTKVATASPQSSLQRGNPMSTEGLLDVIHDHYGDNWGGAGSRQSALNTLNDAGYERLLQKDSISDQDINAFLDKAYTKFYNLPNGASDYYTKWKGSPKDIVMDAIRADHAARHPVLNRDTAPVQDPAPASVDESCPEENYNMVEPPPIVVDTTAYPAPAEEEDCPDGSCSMPAQDTIPVPVDTSAPPPQSLLRNAKLVEQCSTDYLAPVPLEEVLGHVGDLEPLPTTPDLQDETPRYGTSPILGPYAMHVDLTADDYSITLSPLALDVLEGKPRAGLKPEDVRARQQYAHYIIERVTERNKTADVSIHPYEKLNQFCHESIGLNPKAVGTSGERGICQFMPETGAKYGLYTDSDFFDPYKNIDAGIQHCYDLRKIFSTPEVALIAYNGGEGAGHKVNRGEGTMSHLAQRNVYYTAKFEAGEIDEKTYRSRYAVCSFNYVNNIMRNNASQSEKQESAQRMQALGLYPIHLDKQRPTMLAKAESATDCDQPQGQSQLADASLSQPTARSLPTNPSM